MSVGGARGVGAFALAISIAAIAVGCSDRGSAQVCPVPTEFHQTNAMIGGFEGVDFLVVVDNSISMAQEQKILATSFYPLVNALVDPLPFWEYPAHDDVRVAVVTSDMGLGFEGICDPGECSWMGGTCTGLGDDGRFQEYRLNEKVPAIDVMEGVIPCGEGASQCPAGWTCDDMDADTHTGVCNDPDGDGTGVVCPPMGEDPFAFVDDDNPNTAFATQVACLADQGTSGCGVEQQLEAAARGLSREDQEGFVRRDALLVVMVVSDEEDCSIEDPAIYVTDEFTGAVEGPTRINLACSNHPEYLHPTSRYYQLFNDVKGHSSATIFVGIVGVPPDEVCQGTGDRIGDCLDHDKMQLEEILEQNSVGQQSYNLAPACTREEGGEVVTRATPGRRYVELAADDFERMSYIYSICNADWAPAMEEVSRLVASNLCGSCFPRPLEWDPATSTSRCQLVVEFWDTQVCPTQLMDPDPEIVTGEDHDGISYTNALCRVPEIPVPLDCGLFDAGKLDSQVGWYYCTNIGVEDFSDACQDGVDNDEDGLVDCDDDECQACTVCNGSDTCSARCMYEVELTEAAKDIVIGKSISVICPMAFASDDPNCQENTATVCADGVDNDNDGRVDCSDVTEGVGYGEMTFADPDCCPMERDPETGMCVNIETGICGGMSDACFAAASLLQCSL